jgi:putative FmdB family regulatory protein
MARPWSPVGIVWHSNGPSASTPSDPEEVDVPTYEYRCRSCGHELEVVQSFSDDALTECPNCQGQLRKVFGSIGVTFKGTGFYKNDSRSSGSSTSTSSGSSTSGGSSEGGGSSGDSSSGGSGSSGSSDSSGSSSGSSGSSAAPTPST